MMDNSLQNILNMLPREIRKTRDISDQEIAEIYRLGVVHFQKQCKELACDLRHWRKKAIRLEAQIEHLSNLLEAPV